MSKQLSPSHDSYQPGTNKDYHMLSPKHLDPRGQLPGDSLTYSKESATRPFLYAWAHRLSLLANVTFDWQWRENAMPSSLNAWLILLSRALGHRWLWQHQDSHSRSPDEHFSVEALGTIPGEYHIMRVKTWNQRKRVAWSFTWMLIVLLHLAPSSGSWEPCFGFLCLVLSHTRTFKPIACWC